MDISFQSESKKSGDAFEELVLLDLQERKFSTIFKNVEIENTGCEIDFLAKSWQSTEYVEAKGGNPGTNKRPGAKRTDSVKKAIANGALIKSIYPDAYYVVYFSSEPEAGSYSDKMIIAAKRAGFLDEVRYLIG